MSLEERGKALEEAFFAKKNKELLERIRQDLDAKERRILLKAVTGISEDDMLDRIIATGVDAKSLAAISLAPLIFVAWADGNVDAKEREAIVLGAKASGIEPDSAAGQLIDGWLSEEPDESLLATWTEYTHTMCENLQAGDQVRLQDQVMGRSRKVAEAAGGFLGLGSISAKEQEVLASLKKAFE